MKREDDQELWDLLGKVEPATVSPFFARNVLRRVREERTWRDRLATWLRPRRLIPATTVAAALVAAASLTFQKTNRAPVLPEATPDSVAQMDATDYEVVADLDDLLAMDEDSWWDSDTPTL
jgi:hypothetical protein